MPANLQERIEQLARLAVLSDAGDLPGLVSLQEQAVSLAAEAGEDGVAEIEALARQISTLAESIVLRKVEDADAAFREIGAGIDRLQHCLAAPVPDSNAPAQPEDDDDALIAAWVSGCEGMLSDLEGRLLALERTPGDAEVIADIRRTMHTLKGECGVLSLHTAQKLFHEAESLVDRCVDTKTPLPIDPFLALLDWVRSYVTRLSTNSHAAPDGHDRVLLAITNAHPGDTPTPTPVPTSAPAAPIAAAPAPPVSSVQSVTPAPAAPPTAPTGQAPAPQDGVVVDPTPVAFGPQPGTEENLADFICEAKDHLANSEEALLALDQDRSNLELINTVFRAFHTIKGVSGFMALTPIVSLAHSAEQLLDGARSGLFTLGRAELDLILASCDMMTRLLAVLEGSTGPTRGDFETLVRLLDASARPGAAPTPHQTASAPIAPSTPAAAPHPVASNPSTTPAAPVPSTVNAASTSVAPPAPAAAQPAARPAETPTAEGDNANSKIKRADQTVKVNTSRMDSLVTMVGELVIAQQMVVQDVVQSLGGAAQGQRVQRTLSHMGKMIRDLQEVSMSLRMVNLKSTFQKMTRLVRDVSQRAGKQIEVVTEGEDVELDRNVVEAITDPLVHMIRNSCDHGVEPADERRAAGKSPTGRVALRAYHAGGSIVIEIADDGRGLRREKLLAKARSKGLLPPDIDESAMSDAEVYGLIFLPGFSTAEQVTDISGRGVGMDVVRRNIEALRGKIEIRSEPGKGTTFLMRLPLTMAIIDGMIVRVGAQRYVLPTLSINQSFRPRPEDLKTAVNVGEMVRVRGDMLPIYRLNRVLALAEGADDIADALLIVMESDDARFCLMVDEILGQQQVVIKSLNQTGQNLRGVSGGAILGDGRVALILDVGQIVSLAREGCGGARRTGAEPAPELAASGA